MGNGRILILCMLCLHGNFAEWSKESSFRYVGNLTKSKATAVCQSYGMALPGQLGLRGSRVLRAEMKKHGISSTWTSIHRVQYDDWTATAEGISGRDVPEIYNRKDNATCGLITVLSKRVRATSCTNIVRNYFCFLKVCNICHHWNCLLLEEAGSCIKFGRGHVNWFQAKAECNQMSGYLLPFRRSDTDDVSRISHLLDGDDKEAWVGWSMEDWVVQDQRKRALQDFRFRSKTLNGNGNCAVIKEEDVMWERKTCESVVPTLCISEPSGTFEFPQ